MAFPLAFSGFLLAMQAAGAVVDYRNMQTNMGLIKQGRELESAQFQSNLEALKVESEEQSLDEMRQLRQNIGTQIVTNAARGNSMAGSGGYGLINKSIGAFNSDERTRRMNLLAKESALRANDVLSGLHTLQSETQLGQAFGRKMFDTIPISAAASAFGQSELGKRWGFGEQKKSGYGLQEVY